MDDQTVVINSVYRSILYNIKILLKLLLRTNNNKLRTALGISNIKIYLYKRLQKLKIKYEMNFKEKLTNKIIIKKKFSSCGISTHAYRVQMIWSHSP